MAVAGGSVRARSLSLSSPGRAKSSNSSVRSSSNVISTIMLTLGVHSEVPLSSDGKMVCAICLEEMDEEEGNLFTVPNCSHTFHNDCIAQWKEISRKCPFCRGLLPDEIGPTYPKLRNLPAEEVHPALTRRHMIQNVMYTPCDILYPLCLFFLMSTLEILLFLISIVPFFFVLLYGTSHEEDRCTVVILIGTIITYPIQVCCFIGLLAIQICYMLYRTLMCYVKILMCNLRWTDSYSFIIERTLTITRYCYDIL